MPRDLHAEAEAAAGDFLAMYDEDAAAGRVRARADYLARFPEFHERIARELDELLARGLAAAPGAAPAGRMLGRYRLLATLPDRPARFHAVLEMTERIARALHAAHEAGVVHRDVKPQNVMLTADDEPVVLDFGTARFEDEDGPTRTRSGEVFGSLA